MKHLVVVLHRALMTLLAAHHHSLLVASSSTIAIIMLTVVIFLPLLGLQLLWQLLLAPLGSATAAHRCTIFFV